MGCFEGTELCELVGLCILQNLVEKYRKHRIGWYRNVGLACFEYTSGPQADTIRKDFIKTFQEDFDLSINLRNKLDVTSQMQP